MAKKQYQPAPPPKPAKRDEFKVDMPPAAFPINFYANTYGIEDVDANKVIHFGLMVGGRLMGGRTFVFDGPHIEQSRASWLQYLSDIGYPDKEDPGTFRAAPREDGVPYVNMATLARTGNVAEFRLFSFSIGEVVDDRRSAHSGIVKGQPVGIVRVPLDLQRQLIIALFGNPNP